MTRRQQWAPGQAILNYSWLGTLIFAFSAAAAAIWPNWFEWLNVAVSLLLFVLGTAAMLWAFLIAVERSRQQIIGVSGLYLAMGSAPRQVQKILLTSLAVEIAVALITAAVRIYSPAAFGILVPVWGIGLTGMWCARHGEFKVRETNQQNG